MRSAKPSRPNSDDTAAENVSTECAAAPYFPLTKHIELASKRVADGNVVHCDDGSQQQQDDRSWFEERFQKTLDRVALDTVLKTAHYRTRTAFQRAMHRKPVTASPLTRQAELTQIHTEKQVRYGGSNAV